MAEACNTAFGIPTWVVGLVVAAISAFIFIGGVGRIASFTEKVVPIMACLYLLGSLILLICRIQYIPETFAMIFKYAFAPNAIIGGGIGYALKTAISQGAKRGLFSNEAGMGSTPHAHAQANVAHPHDQGVVAMAGVGNPNPFLTGLRKHYNVIEELVYDDHHVYRRSDLQTMLDAAGERGVIVTTEKDAVKLTNRKRVPASLQKRLYVMPVYINFRDMDDEKFIQNIINDVKQN